MYDRLGNDRRVGRGDTGSKEIPRFCLSGSGEMPWHIFLTLKGPGSRTGEKQNSDS